jgi:hypothetical protein
MYFAFSNPTYDNNCGFNCNTITGVPVIMDSLDIEYLSLGQSITISGYANAQTPDNGPTGPAIDTMTVIGTGAANQVVTLDWDGIEEVSMTGNSYYVNDITVNIPVGVSQVGDGGAVPEPSALVLLGTGLLSCGLVVRRRLHV